MEEEEDPNLVKVPTRVEWDNESVGVYIEDDDEALLMTAQDGVSDWVGGQRERNLVCFRVLEMKIFIFYKLTFQT